CSAVVSAASGYYNEKEKHFGLVLPPVILILQLALWTTTPSLFPLYRKTLKCHKLQSYSVNQWSEDVIKRLQGSLACTDWDIFEGNLEEKDTLPEADQDKVLTGRTICFNQVFADASLTSIS
ncbi:hypothetical protein GBF38_012754, partial [Nibea albiflora]